MPRATPKGAEAPLPSGSYTSAPDVGTDTPGHPPAIGTDSHSKPALASEECAELQPRDWQPGLAWQAPDVRDFASAAQAGAASSVTCRIHLAPSAPIAVLPLLALPCLFPLTLPLPKQLRELSPVYRYLRPGRQEIPPLVGIRVMSWLVARFLMLLWLHLVM